MEILVGSALVIIPGLVVDDFEPFRQLVRSIWRPKPELQIVGEAADGLEAFRERSS